MARADGDQWLRTSKLAKAMLMATDSTNSVSRNLMGRSLCLPGLRVNGRKRELGSC